MATRPKIKLTLSAIDNALERAATIFLFIMWALTFYTFFKLPVTVPTHFNASGQVDGYGSKITLLIVPGLATVIYFGLTQLNKYPHLFNYIRKITKDNAQKQYTIATRMLRFLKLAILIIFSLIILFTFLTTTGVTKGLGNWFLPLTLTLLFVPTIIAIFQSLHKKDLA